MNKNIRLAQKHGAKILPFSNLPIEACYAIVQYMVVDGDAWEICKEMKDALNKGNRLMDKNIHKAQTIYKNGIKKSMAFYKDKYGDCKFGYVKIPMSVIKEKYIKDVEILKHNGKNFEAYHRWYKEHIGIPKHSKTKTWPVILSEFDDELLEDGWHRFHRYIDLGLKKIPCIYYLPRENYKLKYKLKRCLTSTK